MVGMLPNLIRRLRTVIIAQAIGGLLLVVGGGLAISVAGLLAEIVLAIGLFLVALIPVTAVALAIAVAVFRFKAGHWNVGDDEI